MKTLTTIFLLFILSNLNGQSWDENLNNLIANSTNYRDEILTKDTSQLNVLSKRINHWKTLVPLNELYSNLFFHLNYYSATKTKLKSTKKYIAKSYPVDPILDFLEDFSTLDYQLIKSNSELLDLIDIGLLEEKSPFVLKNNAKLFEEIKFYQIKNYDEIAEIGAGNGTFSLLLTLMNPNIQLTINEINSKQIKYIKKKFNHFNTLYELNNFDVVFGSKKKTRIRRDVNKVIIRNTFHHISEKEQILSSIYENLKPNGILYIQEQIKHPKKLNVACEYLLSEKELLNSIPSELFKLTDKINIEEITIFKFEKNKRL